MFKVKNVLRLSEDDVMELSKFDNKWLGILGEKSKGICKFKFRW